MKNWSTSQINKYKKLRSNTQVTEWLDLAKLCFPDASIQYRPIPQAETRPPLSLESVKIPAELADFYNKAIYLEANYECRYILSQEQLIELNNKMRTDAGLCSLYMPFDNLLIFGETGNGDYLFFPITGSGKTKNEVFLWDHETDARAWFASSLRDMIIRLSVENT